MASIKEIAAKAEVSISTVSLVLNGKAETLRISKETQKKVMEIAESLGYSPRNKQAAVPDKVVSIVFFLATNISNMIVGNYMSGYQRALIETSEHINISLQLYEKSKLSECATFLEGKFDGAVIMSPGQEDYRFLHENRFRFPIVLNNRESDKYPHVCIDLSQVGTAAADILFRRGHTKVAIVLPDSETAEHVHMSPFLERCRHHGVDHCHVIIREMSLQGGYEAAELLAELRPTAAFFAIDVMAVSAVSRLMALGIALPEEMEVIAFGTSEINRYVYPSISSISVAAEEMILSAVDLLLEHIHGAYGRKKVLLETDVVFRATCPAPEEALGKGL